MPAPPFIPEHTRSQSFRRTTGFSVPTKTPARSSRSQRVRSPRRLGGTRSKIITTIGVLRIVDTALNASHHGVPQPRGQGGNAPLRELPKRLAHDSLYPDAASLVTFLGLHDMPRFLHRQGAAVDGLKQAFTFLLTTRGIPMKRDRKSTRLNSSHLV